jgi:hypothetical protein
MNAKKNNENKIRTMVNDDGTLPVGLVDNVDKACELILECFEMNKISKSAGVSAMATLIVSILATYEKDDHFVGVMKLMAAAFKEHRNKA